MAKGRNWALKNAMRFQRYEREAMQGLGLTSQQGEALANTVVGTRSDDVGARIVGQAVGGRAMSRVVVDKPVTISGRFVKGKFVPSDRSDE